MTGAYRFRSGPRRSRIYPSAIWWDVDAEAQWRTDHNVMLNGAETHATSWLSGGNVYDLLQATPADQPLWTAADADFASSPGSILLDGVSETLREIAGSGTLGALLGGDDTAFTVCATLKLPTTAGTDALWSLGTSTSGNYYHDILSSSTGIQYHDRRDTTPSTAAGTNAVNTTRHNLIAEFAGTTASTWIDNVIDLNAGALNKADFGTNPDRTSIGARSRSSSFTFGNVKFIELRVYLGTLSTAKRTAVFDAMDLYAGGI